MLVLTSQCLPHYLSLLSLTLSPPPSLSSPLPLPTFLPCTHICPTNPVASMALGSHSTHFPTHLAPATNPYSWHLTSLQRNHNVHASNGNVIEYDPVS